ncbi:hypothetical protein CGZ94_12755 [Enemella evansiae]|uniref:Probable endolytic peptidoglycan transglycosylase RlpA n=1 Tax=Enemella evansiae TaxID=2016499 RepID=A0A255GA15_9ACTN|nr:hypothetical protein CGZ94_12755 [Enemella evansiae]
MSASTKIARRLLGAGALGGVLVASLSTAAFACERTGGSSSSSGSQQRTVASRSASSDDGSQQRSSHHHTKHSRSHAGSTGSGSSDSNASSNRTVSRVSSGASAGASSAGTTSTGTASTGGTTCTASMYDEGQLTATGEQFDPQGLTAASLTLPLNSTATVTNPQNGKSVTVRINDRGPYISGRCIDLSAGAFAAIGDPNDGLMQVNVTPAG